MKRETVCSSIQQEWMLAFDADQPPPETTERHLERCPACRAFAAAGERLRREIRRMPTPEADPAVDRKLLAALRERGGSPVIHRFLSAMRALEDHRPRHAARHPARLAFSLALLAFVALVCWRPGPPRDLDLRIARRTDSDLLPRKRERGRAPGEKATPAKSFHRENAKWAKTRKGKGMGMGMGMGMESERSVTTVRPSHLSVDFAFSPISRFRDEDAGSERSRDDMAGLNGDPAALQYWASVPADEWGEIEARVRAAVRVRDDFVTIPFPRLASTAERQIAQAAESYKREAAIVDPRLSHEVTCAYKATALSDLCDRLRADTGIQLAAGPSVADEKVTVFCERLPLREVMRQLSRPFGYTWLRTGRVLGVGRGVSGPTKTDSSLTLPDPTPDTRHPTPQYCYELVQDLRSQLLEEELRNRDRNAALLALEKEIDRYRPYRDLSPDEALARSKTAATEEKKLLEKLARAGWGPLQMYFRLSPQDQAALRAGQTLKFGADPRPGDPPNVAAQPLPPDVARGVLQSMREKRLLKQESGYSFAPRQDVPSPDALPPAVVPEARASVNLRLEQSELGQLTLDGMSGFAIVGTRMFTGNGDGPYAIGVSPTVLQPRNEEINARLASEADLRPRVSVQPQPSCGVVSRESSVVSKDPRQPGTDTHDSRLTTHDSERVTSADVLEALHRATGLPIVADYYTHLYRAGLVSARIQPLFEALNHLSDGMRLRWMKEGPWLQFRSTSFYNDRLKEVPNRLLARWAAARRERGMLRLDEILEIAQLSDAQLDAAEMAEGARECWGLAEWDLARGKFQRSHWRYLAQLTPAQRQEAISAGGLAFTRMSLAQQQQFISLCDHPVQSLEELAGATLRVGYTQPGGFQWAVPEEEAALPGRGAIGLSPVHERTRAAALQAARRIDPQVDPAQIVPTDLGVTVVYTLGGPKSRIDQIALQVTAEDVRMWGHIFRPDRRSAE